MKRFRYDIINVQIVLTYHMQQKAHAAEVNSMTCSRRLIFKVFIAAFLIITPGYSPYAVQSQAYAGNEALADQVVRILTDESDREKIKVIMPGSE